MKARPLVVAVAAALGPGEAHAGDGARAADLFESAIAFVDQGRWDAACLLFRESLAADLSVGAQLHVARRSELCVWVEGASVPCPGGAFVNASEVFRGGHDDARVCAGTCTCGASSGAACAGAAYAWSGSDCMGNALTVSLDGTCASTASATASAQASVALAPGACSGSSYAPAGSVTGLDPVTVCCTNPL